jgi:FdhE protein
MKASLDDRIGRATELLRTHSAARELLNFYRELALYQKPVYQELRSSDQTDIRALLNHFSALLELVRRTGPERLAEFGAEHLQSPDAQDRLLLATWEDRAGNDLESSEAGRFYARVLLQPFAEYLASKGRIEVAAAEATCPFCGARPVAAVLRGEGDGAKRWLLCSMCSTEWPFRP